MVQGEGAKRGSGLWRLQALLAELPKVPSRLLTSLIQTLLLYSLK